MPSLFVQVFEGLHSSPSLKQQHCDSNKTYCYLLNARSTTCQPKGMMMRWKASFLPCFLRREVSHRKGKDSAHDPRSTQSQNRGSSVHQNSPNTGRHGAYNDRQTGSKNSAFCLPNQGPEKLL